MNEEKRINAGYEIIESCTIGSTELVIGHNPKAPNPYVCWYCKNGTDISGAAMSMNFLRRGRN